MKLYDKTVIAVFLNMSVRNVERLTEKGVLKTKQGKLYNLLDTIHDYIEYLQGKNGNDWNLNEERAKLTRIKRQKEELELKEIQGELHRSEVIEKIMTATLINFKTRLLAIASEEAERLATITDKAKIFLYLNEKIKEALHELSDFETVFSKEIEEIEEKEKE